MSMDKLNEPHVTQEDLEKLCEEHGGLKVKLAIYKWLNKHDSFEVIELVDFIETL